MCHVRLYLCLFLYAFSFLYGQTIEIKNLGECSFALLNPNPPSGQARDGTLRWEGPIGTHTTPGWYCRDNNTNSGALGPEVYRVEETNKARIYGCPENESRVVNSTQACLYHEICNFDPPRAATCINMNHDGRPGLSSNTKDETGNGLFTFDDQRSACFITPTGGTTDLTSVDPNTVEFDDGVMGVEHHCRELLFLYQNQLSRTGAASGSFDTFTLDDSH